MNLPLAARIARREMRGGLGGFIVFLLCLMLGVAAIAAVGTVREAIQSAIRDQGAVLLGGDAEMSFTYRYASAEERAFMEDRADRVAEIVDFRSMAVVGDGAAAERALTQIKGVDAAYPLTGQLLLDPAVSLAEALAIEEGVPGAVLDPVLADRLGLKPGDRFRLGTKEFRATARLIREPDGATSGFTFGPRTIVHTDDLAGSGLLEPGSLFDTHYRLLLPEGADLDAMRSEAEAAFRDTGLRWRDARRGAPGMQRFVDRMGSFLVLVGLAGLAVGGVGIGAAVTSYLDGRVETMAALKAMGAESGTIFAVYLIQVGVLAAIGILAGLTLGAALPVLAGPLIAARLPIPVEMVVAWRPLAEAGSTARWPQPSSRSGRWRALAMCRRPHFFAISAPGGGVGRAGGWG